MKMKRFRLSGVIVMLGALASLGMTIGSAQATIITWNFDSPAGSVTSPHTYFDTTNTFQIIASGFTTTNAAPTNGTWTPGTVASTPLFGKLTSGDPSETGLGLDLGEDHEIAVKSMIQLDLANLIAKGLTDPILSIGSVQAGESFALFGSNTAADGAGATGSFLNGGTGGLIQTFPLIGYPSDRYVWIAATNEDVLLLNGLTSAAAPEPSALLLLGSGLLGIAGIAWRRNRK